MNIFHRLPPSPIASAENFKTLYEQNRLPVFRYIYGLTGGPQDDVEDLTAETFLRAWKARQHFEGNDASATGWLIRIAKRLVIDEYRRANTASRSLPLDPPVEPMPEQSTMDEEQRRHLFALLRDLPDEQREIITLRYLLGWRVSDISRHIGATENNVSVTIHRTLARLREKWIQIDSGSLKASIPREESTS